MFAEGATVRQRHLTETKVVVQQCLLNPAPQRNSFSSLVPIQQTSQFANQGMEFKQTSVDSGHPMLPLCPRTETSLTELPSAGIQSQPVNLSILPHVVPSACDHNMLSQQHLQQWQLPPSVGHRGLLHPVSSLRLQSVSKHMGNVAAYATTGLASQTVGSACSHEPRPFSPCGSCSPSPPLSARSSDSAGKVFRQRSESLPAHGRVSYVHGLHHDQVSQPRQMIQFLQLQQMQNYSRGCNAHHEQRQSHLERQQSFPEHIQSKRYSPVQQQQHSSSPTSSPDEPHTEQSQEQERHAAERTQLPPQQQQCLVRNQEQQQHHRTPHDLQVCAVQQQQILPPSHNSNVQPHPSAFEWTQQLQQVPQVVSAVTCTPAMHPQAVLDKLPAMGAHQEAHISLSQYQPQINQDSRHAGYQHVPLVNSNLYSNQQITDAPNPTHLHSVHSSVLEANAFERRIAMHNVQEPNDVSIIRWANSRMCRI